MTENKFEQERNALYEKHCSRGLSKLDAEIEADIELQQKYLDDPVASAAMWKHFRPDFQQQNHETKVEVTDMANKEVFNTKEEFLLGQIQDWWDCIRGSELAEGLWQDPDNVEKFYPDFREDEDDTACQIEKDAKELFGRLKELLKQNV